jgi:hypothetical protein
MEVVEDRKDIVLRAGAERGVVIGAGGSFEDAPPVVAAAHDRRVHLFARALSDVGDPLRTGEAIEAESPWVAHSVGEDLGATGRRAKEGIRRRRRVGERHADVDPQNLPEQEVNVLRVVGYVVAAAAIADADV